MGPRLVSRGKADTSGPTLGGLVSLQWGRDLLVAESVRVADVVVVESAASMGPRLVSRGKATPGSWDRCKPTGFNGAATC